MFFMEKIVSVECVQLIITILISIFTCASCSCNDRNREQIHLQRRQALRNRQRDAVISGRSVRSVIETEVDSDESQCPRLSCVRMAPRLKSSETADVYERLNQCEEHAEHFMEKEKPPPPAFSHLTRKSDSVEGADKNEHEQKRCEIKLSDSDR